MLARLFQQHTGGDLQSSLDYLIEHIYVPMGIGNAIFETDAGGGFVGSSYWYATARDWARVGYLMLNKGMINGHRIVSEEYVGKATSPNASGNDHAYGYQFWLNRGNDWLVWPHLPEDTFAAEGDREQRVMIIPSENLVIVRIGWSDGEYPADRNFSEIVAALH
jgi:CubicO group peptidase (beta-lactamase class C family)